MLAERCEIIIYIIIVAIDFPSIRKLYTITAAMELCVRNYIIITTKFDRWEIGR